uniref:C-type lectin domain-containing protein n=1 Tax=Ditylenchus dipsaci TaxID=166011 RepID=A0A915DPE1_9BILA
MRIFYFVLLSLVVAVSAKSHKWGNHHRIKCEAPRKNGYYKSFCYSYHAEPLGYKDAFIQCAKEGGWLLQVNHRRHFKYIQKQMHRQYGIDGKRISIGAPEEQRNIPIYCEFDKISPCPAGWRHYEGQCYKVAKVERGYFHFNSAEAKCVEEQSHLASVHSFEENEFIANMLNTGLNEVAFLGYRRHNLVNNQPGSVSNIDGSDASFAPTAFQSGLYLGLMPCKPEPNNEQGDQNCIVIGAGIQFYQKFQMNGGKYWHDVACERFDYAKGAICKKAAASRPLKC